ncbi:MAG: pyridoxamine 5'-phosphate oxidase family protein [Actinomycetia bacterium]|nr:pyridoxamine 5'-phosphate oxidase family protein [Actinomycetes bacterium]MCP4227695.1 pyridoxamine 5'-phosphate oxidase family protein [Actinomycetes bacterium]MCP5033968.1 pyridoxamine 5'-phosphate oxidase family protein [Actinomycetes bacterium]
MNVPELQELSEDQCWRMLAKKKVGRLAVSVENRPDIFPVNYQIDGDSIVVRTAAGLKLAAATLGPSVAFEVDALDELNHSGWSVVVHGPASEVEGVEELIDADRLLIEPWSRGPAVKNRYLRIKPSELTGRRIPGAGNNPTMAPGPDWE